MIEYLLKMLNLEALKKSALAYLEAQIDLIKYDIQQSLFQAISRILIIALLTLLGSFILLFSSLAVAFCAAYATTQTHSTLVNKRNEKNKILTYELN